VRLPWRLQLDKALSLHRRVSPEEPAKAFRQRRRGVILGVDGISDFNALQSGKHNEEVQLRKPYTPFVRGLIGL
jgi:hypothetical protein